MSEKEQSPLELFSGMGGIDMIKIMELFAEYGPKIKAFIPKIVEFFPKIKEWETAQNLKSGEMILYSAMATNNTIFIYVNKVYQNDMNEVVLSEQLHKFDLMELVTKYSSYIPG